MLDLQSGKSSVCRSVSTGPQSFLWTSSGLGHVWRFTASKVGQDCRMWLGVWGPVPHGHSSEWENFTLWRWERSWQCPVLSLKIVTWADVSSWWMLSSPAPMSRRCRHSVLKLFLRNLKTKPYLLHLVHNSCDLEAKGLNQVNKTTLSRVRTQG